MSPPRAVLFDAGGTLVTMHPTILGDMLEPIIGERPDPDRMFVAHFHAMAAVTQNAHLIAESANVWWPWWLERFLSLSGVSPHPDAVAALANSHGVWRHPLPGAIEGVAAVAAAGYRIAVVSNADGRVAEDLAAAGFDGLFEAIIDSTVVGVAKPDPAIFTFALEALGVAAADTWYVGDSRVFDLAGAEAAGLAEFVLVDPVGVEEDYQPQIAEIGELLGLLNPPS